MFFKIPEPSVFPSVSRATADGLLAWGGLVTPEFVLDALSHGIFPWTISSSDISPYVSDATEENLAIELETRALYETLPPEIRYATWNGYGYDSLWSVAEVGDALCWFAPEPRGIFELDEIHVPSRLQRKMRSGKFQVTFDQAFPEVMLGCACSGKRQEEGCWIYKEFFCGYCKLYEMGFAHSAECWLNDGDFTDALEEERRLHRKLVGGVYGVALNSFFAGESMFSVETDSSKIALFSLLNRLRENGFQLFDLQVLNAHTQSLGGKNIHRDEYMKRLKNALQTSAIF